MFNNLEHDLEPFIGGPTKSPQDPHAVIANSPFSWLFDNPIITILMKLNPLPFILETLSESAGELLGDDFSFPSIGKFSQKATEILNNAFQSELSIVITLLESLWNRIKDVAKDVTKVLEALQGALKDIAHALFNAIRTGIKAIWSLIPEFIELVNTFLKGKWKIPFITDFFTWYADQVCAILAIYFAVDESFR
jgi:hypothetical protein